MQGNIKLTIPNLEHFNNVSVQYRKMVWAEIRNEIRMLYLSVFFSIILIYILQTNIYLNTLKKEKKIIQL